MQVLKFFVVDDDYPSAVMSAEFHLEDERCQISFFKHGEACLQAMDQSPDVILMDVEMLGMGGIPACRTIRESANERTQIIFFSSHNNLEMRLAAYDAGATDYIVKRDMCNEFTKASTQNSDCLSGWQRPGGARSAHAARRSPDR